MPANYFILDVSAELQHSQQALLKRELAADVFQRVQWLQSLPNNFSGVVIANEVFDAFAVERFAVLDGVIQRLMVNVADDKFYLSPCDDTQVQHDVHAIQNDIGAEFSDGFQSEYCRNLRPWWNSLAECIDKAAVIVCDYGAERKRYYAPQKSSGTLRCFFRHTLHDDPFARPAIQDVTADVDFTAVTIAATEAGFELQGYSPLSEFMLSLGVLEHHQRKNESRESLEQMAAMGNLKRVIMPQEMGDRFMVIGFSVGLDLALEGFSRADWSRLL